MKQKMMAIGLLLWAMPFSWIWAADESLLRAAIGGSLLYDWLARGILVVNILALGLALYWLFSGKTKGIAGKGFMLFGLGATVAIHGFILVVLNSQVAFNTAELYTRLFF